MSRLSQVRNCLRSRLVTRLRRLPGMPFVAAAGGIDGIFLGIHLSLYQVLVGPPSVVYDHLGTSHV